MSDARHPSSRRRFLFGTGALVGATLLGGCDRLGKTPWFRRLLDKDEDANLYVQRLLLSNQKLAPEFAQSDISPWFKPNGTSDPSDSDYKALVKTGFKGFRLAIDGLVERPQTFSLADLRGLPSRTQITRHDCVEGWSCIGQWKGVPLGALLERAGMKPQARFLVFYCADTMDEGGGLEAGDQEADADSGDADEESGGAKATMKPADPKAQQPDTGAKSQANGSQDKKQAKAEATKPTAPAKPPSDPSDPGSRYYESIDLEDAYHPQTILAYEMNGQALPVAHGAPLRLRVERQLGYKMAKYVMRIAVVDKLETIGKGGGGYWEDNGYEWYAGI